MTRLDALLVRRGLSPSREKAKEIIEAGLVRVDGAVRAKPAFACPDDAAVEVDAPAERFVSRGGLKLERALDVFGIGVSGRRCLDLGASTGGFTDCMLGRGAARVTAVDVGSGQLAAALRAGGRVTSLEHTDFRALPRETYAAAEFVSADLSFISLRLLFPALAAVPAGTEAVCLVKPQFEAGRGAVNKRGVVRDPAVWERVLREVTEAAALAGFACLGLTYSPVRGQNGNVEFLLHLQRSEEAAAPGAAFAREAVREARVHFTAEPV